ncbi:smoothelin isoform X2 [Pristis pectinata]|uniref:smoothelin isoform X2 n=1 Tax=Pristis pectinata TaxID=685728 RepID=UPI00223D33F3|nr:smoothelin isoform X2 [Pristis pectinata]
MSADRYSSLDEPALRKLLEVTDDFDERKLIRSMIYELRRKELKRTEDALSSKRFRSERTNKCLENKENHLRSHRQEEDQKGSLDKLSGKLESINDIDELTTLLRSAGEYEERKLIRAAMRKLREQEIEAASIGDRPIGRPVHNGAQETEKTTTYRLDIAPQTIRSSKDLLAKCEENVLRTLVAETEDLEPRPKIRAQIQELQNQKNSQKMASGMVVVLDPLKNIDDSSMKSLQSSRQTAESSGLDPCTCITDSDWGSESGKDSSRGLTAENPGSTSETHWTIKTQHNEVLQKMSESSPSIMEEDDDAKKTNTALRQNSCPSLNNNRNTFAPKIETTVLQAEISSQNGMLTFVQERLNSDISDNIPSITTRRASDKEQGETCFTELDKMITYKAQMPRNTATQSKQKELTETAIDTCLNGSLFRRTNSVRDRMKKFTVDLSNQSAELGTNFSTQKRKQLNENRGSRILQQQQPLSGSPTPKIKESVTSGLEVSLKGSSVDLRNMQEVDKSTEKTDKHAEYLLSSRNKKPVGSNKKNGLERNRSTSLRDSLFNSEQVDGKDSPKSVNRLTYSTAKFNFTTPEVQPQGCSRETSSSVSSESLSHPIASRVTVDGSSKSISPLSFEKDCNKKSLTQKTATDKSYIKTPGRSNISKSQTYQPASEKDSSKTHTGSSVHLEQPRSAQPSDPPATPNRHFQQSFSRQSEEEKQLNNNENNMKTLMTIEIKDGRNPELVTTRISGTPSSQRGELTFGLRATPFKMLGPGGIMMETEPVMTEAAQSLQFEATLPNGVEEKEKENAKEKSSKVIQEDLSAIEDEEVLDKMLDATTDFEKRKMIRAAMRELRKKKRDEREREREMRLQELKQKSEEAKRAKSLNTAEMTVSKTEKSADGKTVTSMSKTERITHTDGGNRTLQTTTVESVVKKTDGGTSVIQTKTSFSSSSTSSKKVGSIFDREDNTRSSSVLALERKQAEKRKEVLRSQTLPRTSGSQARKALIEKLEKEGGSPGNPAIAKVKVQRSSSCGVPNANTIKQMLLDWCRAKTRGYEHVAIQNFSSSWSDGMAFCALVHNFFPEAFDYSELNPNNPRHNFEVAFTMAEKHAECPQLLDVEDMVRMKEPDWKCVYTYIQEYYRCLVQKGLVKTKTSS